MPIYEFQCNGCGRQFEKITSVGVNSTLCPKCLQNAFKVMSATNFKVNGKYTAKTGYTYEGQNRPLGE